MTTSRREALTLGLASVAGISLPGTAAAAAPDCTLAPAWRPGIEGQRRADLGDGRYLNPILSGDRPDPNILKDGDDYYASYTSTLYYPGIVIWHSRNLIDWQPIGPALTTPIGSVWALDLVKHDDRYFIYIPVFDPAVSSPRGPFKIYAIHAASMYGPWSEPVDMDLIGFIDPGHVVGEDGKRYLFLNDGHRVKLTDDGLRRDGDPEQVYKGWPIPADWVIEAEAHEGPKLLRHGDFFYLFSGQGGTAGPPTSHMVVVARSRSIHGPWENCPHNPIVRTTSAAEPWWSRGHATPVRGPAGEWWLVYHAYENGYRTLGRQMLLEPFEWTADGWPRALGGDLSRPLAKPRGAPAGAHGIALSDDFHAAMFGTRLAFFDPRPGYLDRARIEDGSLILKSQGTGPSSSSPLAFITGDRSYEVSVDVELEGDTQAGLILFYNEKLFCGLGAEAAKLHTWKTGRDSTYPPPGPAAGRRFTIRIVNDDNVTSHFIRPYGGAWRKVIDYEVAGYNHNIADGFMSLRPAIFASGEGSARFRGLTYRAHGGS